MVTGKFQFVRQPQTQKPEPPIELHEDGTVEGEAVRRQQNLGAERVTIVAPDTRDRARRAIDEIDFRAAPGKGCSQATQAAGGVAAEEVEGSFFGAQRLERKGDVQAQRAVAAGERADWPVAGRAQFFVAENEAFGSLRVG
jgi:hypothetical protein